MSSTLIGHTRDSTDAQDLTAQHQRLAELGVTEDHIYLDHGLTGTNRKRPGLNPVPAVVRAGDTLVVPKLDRLAHSVPDTRARLATTWAACGIRLSLGGQVYDLTAPMGKMSFNTLATLGRVRDRPADAMPTHQPDTPYPPDFRRVHQSAAPWCPARMTMHTNADSC